MSSLFRKRSTLMALSGVVVGVLALTACGGSGTSNNSSGSKTPIEMWTRSTTVSQSKALVDAYNASHDQKVVLTSIPSENYLQKVGVAAGADQLPCLMASDIVFMPNFIAENLYQDISARVDALPFRDKLAKGSMDISSVGSKIYAVPHAIAISVIWQNNVLLEKAGIDPSKPLGSLQELADNAAKVAALGNGVSGLYYTGNGASSIAFTHFPFIWASGGEALSADGKKSLLDSKVSIEVFQIFNQMFTSGASPPSVKSETSATRNAVFGTGKVGYVLGSNSVLQSVPETTGLKIGVQGIPGLNGGESTFVGGDVIGISKSCKDVSGAWDFLSWSLTEPAQVGVLAKINQLVVRSDFANNKYAAADPRMVKLNTLVGEGKTPNALRFGQTFNDPNGPAGAAFTAALFGKDAAAALKAGNPAITASLSGK